MNSNNSNWSYSPQSRKPTTKKVFSPVGIRKIRKRRKMADSEKEEEINLVSSFLNKGIS